MGSVTRPLKTAKAARITEQNQHSDIDPRVTTFLGQGIAGIWQRVQAQPSTYVFTREEYAAFTIYNYYRGVFSDNEIAQQAVQRFWEQHREKGAEDEEQASASNTWEPSQPTYTKRTAVHSPPMTGHIAFQQEQNLRMQPGKALPEIPGKKAKGTGRHSIAIASGKTMLKRLAISCQRCHEARMRCDAKKPVCTPCMRSGRSAECIYTKERKDKRFAESNYNVDERKEFHEKTQSSTFSKESKIAADPVDRREDLIKRDESLMKRSKDLEFEMPKKIQTEQSKGMVSLDSSIERQKEQTSQVGEVDQKYLISPEILPVDLSRSRVQVSNGEEYNLVNSMKLYVEYLTGEAWDWWPLRPSFRQLLQDEKRIQWHCDAGHAHWTVLPKTDPILLQEALKRIADMQVAPLKRKQPKSPSDNDSSTSTSTNRSSGSESSIRGSSPATSESSSSSQPDDEAGSGKEIDPPGASMAVDIVPLSNLTGFVLFGVHGSKRLQSACLRLAQIDVAVYKNDDSFFDEMIVQYKKLRGLLRWMFSIWVFHTCEFIMFHKANPNEIMPGPEEMPSPRDRDYEYNASRDPPILSTVFNANFYGCNKACIKSQLDLLCLFHECKGRNHCGKYRVLERLPKRRIKWDTNRDEEKDEAWGLNAVFAVSFYKVTLYHMLILAGPIIFWGLWLKEWPTDWQNASVPFFAVVVLLSLFWLPFAHNASPADRKRRSKNKSL